MRLVSFLILTSVVLAGCQSSVANKTTGKKVSGCSDDCKPANGNNKKIACKLTSPELRQRKETVLASLKAQVKEKQELANGYAFRFPGSDNMVDELAEFIKTERECCDFFTFDLSISGDKQEAWLKLTGDAGAKEFISSELGL
jgi:hypothetical protein